jgi:hypothetical protein
LNRLATTAKTNSRVGIQNLTSQGKLIYEQWGGLHPELLNSVHSPPQFFVCIRQSL